MEQERAQNMVWEDIPLVERLSVSLGYKLVGLVNEAAGAPLTQRVRGVRQTLSESLGFLLPEVHIRDSLRLKASQYSIQINGEKIDSAELHADRMMAIPSPELYGEIDGILGVDPAYRMQVVWIQPEDKARALNLGYQVIDCASVIATHLNKVIREHLPDVFKHDDVDHLMQRLQVQAPKLAESLKNQLSYTQQHRVYRQLLQEQVPLKDIVTIATTLLEASESTKDPVLLASDVRYALRRRAPGAVGVHSRECAGKHPAQCPGHRPAGRPGEPGQHPGRTPSAQSAAEHHAGGEGETAQGWSPADPYRDAAATPAAGPLCAGVQPWPACAVAERDPGPSWRPYPRYAGLIGKGFNTLVDACFASTTPTSKEDRHARAISFIASPFTPA